MKCPECITEGLASRVYVGFSTSTLMAFQPYYDEDGKYHIHDRNYISQEYSCSKGHRWVEKISNSCPQGDFND